MLLSVDTSTRYLGVALYDEQRVLGEIIWLSQNHHTIELAPAVNALLTHTTMGVEGLDAVAAALGPGSFTGLRIGLAFCKGLALSMKIPIIGVPTIDILAYGQAVTNINLAAVLEAGRDRLAVAWYRAEAGNWTPNGSLRNLTQDEFIDQINPPATICGEISATLSGRILERHGDVNIATPAQSLRRPSFLAELAWQRWKTGRVDEPRTLKPLYLHHGEPIPEG